MENTNYYYDPAVERKRKQDALSVLRKHGSLSGAGVLIFVGASILAALILRVFNLTQYFTNSEVLTECFDIFFTIIAIFIPFSVIMLAAKKHHPDKTFALEKPKSKFLALWSIPAGLMMCLIGDRIASFISNIFSNVGVELTSNTQTLPSSGGAVFLSAISAVIVAPIVEEFAMRAVVMQPLRRYGEVFAIMMTSFVFALMHQNMVQGIFAFIAGVVFGYICIITGSVWCSITIHCLNNLLSVISMMVSRDTASGASIVFYNFLVIAIYIVGIIGIGVMAVSRERPKLKKSEFKNIMTREKSAAFLLAPPMIIAIVIMAINCFL